MDAEQAAAEYAEITAEEISAFEDAEPPWADLDPGIVPLVRAFQQLPGIHTKSSCAGHPDRDGASAEWHIGWVLRSADPKASIVDAGPHPEGWLMTEWLLWHANDLRRARRAIRTDFSVPPPFLNFPGRAMTFWVHGTVNATGALTPDQYLSELKHCWNATGFGDIWTDPDRPLPPAPTLELGKD